MKLGSADDGDREAGLSFACSLVISMHGLEKKGKPMEVTEANKRAFFEQSDGLVEQIVEFAQDRANFFKPA